MDVAVSDPQAWRVLRERDLRVIVDPWFTELGSSFCKDKQNPVLGRTTIGRGGPPPGTGWVTRASPRSTLGPWSPERRWPG
jgi:hypothetical protein